MPGGLEEDKDGVVVGLIKNNNEEENGSPAPCGYLGKPEYQRERRE